MVRGPSGWSAGGGGDGVEEEAAVDGAEVGDGRRGRQSSLGILGG